MLHRHGEAEEQEMRASQHLRRRQDALREE
jgi:hypothetical protein